MKDKTTVNQHRALPKRKFYSEFSDVASSSTSLRSLIEHASGLLASQLGARYVCLYVFTDSSHGVSGGTTGYPKLPQSDVRAISLLIAGRHQSISVHEKGLAERLRRLLVSHTIDVFVPLYRRNTLLGYIFIGPTKKQTFNKQHLELLDSITGEISIAVQNAVSIHAVKELNATLQQRVADATRELQASNAQLQRLDTAKDEFFSMASHQLRTPLTSVKGYISMVIEGDAGEVNDTQKQLLTEAFNSSERMVHLISDFLNVSRLQTGKFLVDKRPTDLSKIVEQELDGLMINAASRSLKFAYDPPKNFPLLMIDENKIRQVIMNFIDNALYYSTEASTIDVRLVVDNDEAVFTVSDSGIGVPEAESAQLFTKFYRASNARKQRPDGTGVGLFLTKKVIEAHGGSVVFESVEGKGSTFGFRLSLRKLSVANANQLENQPSK